MSLTGSILNSQLQAQVSGLWMSSHQHNWIQKWAHGWNKRAWQLAGRCPLEYNGCQLCRNVWLNVILPDELHENSPPYRSVNLDILIQPEADWATFGANPYLPVDELQFPWVFLRSRVVIAFLVSKFSIHFLLGDQWVQYPYPRLPQPCLCCVCIMCEKMSYSR